MLKFTRWVVWNLLLLVVFSVSMTAQNFVYANNDQTTANSISAFSVNLNGALSEITGSPFATGGAGRVAGAGLYSSNRIIVVKGSPNDFLYASNAASNSVSAFTIDSGTGALTSVAGSPFATNAIDDPSYSGISLAATPDGKFLYAGSTGFDGQSFGSITIFSINTSTGSLAMVGAAPVSSGGPMTSMKVSPNGKFLAVALSQSNEVAMFSIQSDGTLMTVSGSPFGANAGDIGTHIAGIDINCASDQLFAGRNGQDIDVFDIASTGALVEPTGSPFSTSVSSNQVVVLSHPDDGTLFSSDQVNNVTAFAVSGGSLTVPGTTVSAGADAISPGGLTVSQNGALLYAADTAISGLGFGGISTFDLVTSPPISSIPPIASTGLTSQLYSLAAYPANACPPPPPPSTSLAATLQISDGPPPAFGLDATLALDSSLVVDPLTQPVTIQIGDFTLNLPAGSFKTFRHGKNAGTYLFQGVVERTTLKVQITPLGPNQSGQDQFQIHALDKHIDLAGLDDPVTVTVGIGDNSASADVTASFDNSLRGNWRDF
jgi:Lactonase, 7-bladed beta-propeller